MTNQDPVDLLVTGGPIYTGDASQPWAESMLVARGKISAVGSLAELRSRTTDVTTVLDTGGRMIMPGLADGHVHLGLGGRQIAWESSFTPKDNIDKILDTVRSAATHLGPDEWVVGGIISGNILYAASDDISYLERLDEAAGHRPVLLRDDSMHNRWVSSRAFEKMGVDETTPDPAGGRFVRDSHSRLTGVLFEVTSSLAEAAHDRSISNLDSHNRASLKTALQVMNSYGVTAVQDAAAMDYSLTALNSLDASGEASAWVVASLPARPFIEAGLTGTKLYDLAHGLESAHVKPSFIKVVMDGMAQTHTSAMLQPYLHGPDEEDEFGEPYWSKDDLVDLLGYCYQEGFNAKIHATGNRSVRVILDSVEEARSRWGHGPIVQIAHAKIVHPDDVARFTALGVCVDAAPMSWVQSDMADAARKTIGDELVDGTWPIRDYLDNGTVVAAGSDWPCVDPLPDPWTGIETMVTRTSLDPDHPEPLNPSQAISLSEAITAFTSATTAAMGLGDTTGVLRQGLSADFIVLDRNIFEIDITDVHATKVDATYFEGRLVYERTI